MSDKSLNFEVDRYRVFRQDLTLRVMHLSAVNIMLKNSKSKKTKLFTIFDLFYFFNNNLSCFSTKQLTIVISIGVKEGEFPNRLVRNIA